MLFDKAIVYYR